MQELIGEDVEKRGKRRFISSSPVEEWENETNGRYGRADGDDDKYNQLGKTKYYINCDGYDKTATD